MTSPPEDFAMMTGPGVSTPQHCFRFFLAPLPPFNSFLSASFLLIFGTPVLAPRCHWLSRFSYTNIPFFHDVSRSSFDHALPGLPLRAPSPPRYKGHFPLRFFFFFSFFVFASGGFCFFYQVSFTSFFFSTIQGKIQFSSLFYSTRVTPLLFFNLAR